MEMVHPLGHGFQEIVQMFDFLTGLLFQPRQPVEELFGLGDRPGLVGTKGRVDLRA